MATAIWDNPDGIIRDVFFPLTGEERLHQLVEEAKQSGNIVLINKWIGIT